MNTPLPPSWRAGVGWTFGAALAALLLSLLVAPPARRLAGFDFPRTLPVAGDGAGGTLAGEPVDLVGPGGWHLAQTFHYRYLPVNGEAAGGVDILATYYVSPRTDARKFPELYSTSPWRSLADDDGGNWVERSSQHTDRPGCAWLQVDDPQGIYLVARIGPDGRCTSTAEQVSRDRLEQWCRPWMLLAWPFSTRPEVDQRAVWVRMTVGKQADGQALSTAETERLWRGVLAAFSARVERSLRD